MFKKTYKEANDCIKGDPQLLAKILKQNENPKIVKFTPRKHHYIATSLAAVFIVCLSLFVFPEFSHKAVEENINPSVTIKNDDARDIKAIENSKNTEDKAASKIKVTDEIQKTEIADLKNKNQSSPLPAESEKEIKEQTAGSITYGSNSGEVAESEIATADIENSPAIAESINAPAISSYSDEITPAYDNSDSDTTTEEPIESHEEDTSIFQETEATEETLKEEAPLMMKSFARVSGGGSSGGGSSAAAKAPFRLHTIPEGYEEAPSSDNMIIYENSENGSKIISEIYESETIHEVNTQIGGIHAYRNGNCFIITKGGISYSITFENISEEEIINIIETNF